MVITTPYESLPDSSTNSIIEEKYDQPSPDVSGDGSADWFNPVRGGSAV